MTSNIDPSKPTHLNPQTADVRNNFLAARDEIIALQNAINSMVISASGSGVFITDVIPTSAGIVAQKTFKISIPVDANIDTAVSDTDFIRVLVACNGGTQSYSPTIMVNGVQAVLIESSTKRWFTGYVDLTIGSGTTVIIATSSENDTDSAIVSRAVAGPSIISLNFGSYPGTQTQLKAGDVLAFNALIDPSAVSVTVYGQTFPVVNGNVSGSLTIGTELGDIFVTASAINSFGTVGATFTSGIPLHLNQTYPLLTNVSVTYPSGKGAFNIADSGFVNCISSNYDSISYSSSDFTIASASIYQAAKPITNNRTGYVSTGTNLTISATKTSNNAITSVSVLGKIATIAPTAAISIIGNPARLVGSAVGISYVVVVTPSQTVLTAPTLNATLGSWVGNWVLIGSTWQRSLSISDGTAKGNGVFSGLVLTNEAGVTGNTITAGSTYVVGGISNRTLTFAAFSRVSAIGTTVRIEVKTNAQIVGGNVLTLYSNNAIHSNGYYIANADGSYNPQGSYVALSDTAFAGANTSGSLQISFSEVA